MLVVKLDAIGDYILFRNYLELLKRSEKYSSYDLELVGNSKWKDLAMEYDSQFVSKFFFIDPEKLYEKPLTIINFARRLFTRKYEVVIQSTYSRTLMGNAVCGFAAGKESVAYNSFGELDPKYKRKTDKFYSSLINLPVSLVHETELNHYFFERLLGSELSFAKPTVPVNKKKREGILIFPGSSTAKKNWEKDKFIEIINRILLNTNEQIIIGGGVLEVPIAEDIIRSNISPRIKNKAGATSLKDFVDLIASSCFVITNDTNAVHIAIAADTPVVAIVGGGHFKRFLPYPEYFASKPICIFSEMPCYNCNWSCDYITSDSEPFPCISNVGVEEVWSSVIKYCNAMH
ncbi:glycosyltransferase family 9 protein [Pedobacter sp. P351]|uniref:glycosyltransferase family 9 protein n=1 Tax=Pedobacter superstes TaxID=3133441 RepID=UPI0030B4F7D3